jgi:hypothetical protein
MKGSNHFKVHILDSLIYNFDEFALDGEKNYHVKVQKEKS